MTYKYFTIEEFNCQETGENAMEESFIHALDILREKCGFPFSITSGFRSVTHSLEIIKDQPGQHTKGIAADIAVANGNQRFLIMKHATELGFSGVGIAKGFVHVDTRTTVPVAWVY
jgi:uncharacterized protein YcbK (DUF882 family)